MAMRASRMKLREIAAHFPGRNAFHIASLLSPVKKDRSSLNEISKAILTSLGEETKPPEYLIAEAVMRAMFPRTPTMKVCGDPVLNQSAAYRAMYGERL
jgi:hypothetical protein